MGTITLPNFRATADVTMDLRLKDGGVYIDWTGLTDIKAWIYSDAQSAIAGRCTVRTSQEDGTVLICEYPGTKAQYPGVNRVIVQARYMGQLKTYDKPVFNFVRWTGDQDEQVTIDDPHVEVEIEVADVSSTILERILAACIKATEEAREVVDVQRGPRGYSAYEVAVQDGFEGTEEEWLLSLQGKSAYEIAVELGYEGTEEQWIASLKGEDGEPGTTPHIGQNGNWFIGDVDTGVAAGGQNGVTPHIGQNGNWFIGDTDTGVLARGTNGVTPHIGANNHWFIGTTDTGVLAEGTDGVTPHIGQNGHWYIGDVDTEVIAEGHDGTDGQDGQDGQDGVGLDTIETPQTPDGTVDLLLTDGNRITIDLNHEHEQYAKTVICASVASYEAIANKDAHTFYIIPGAAMYLGDTLVLEQGGTPLPYTPVEYIETDGNAYINTGIKGNDPRSCSLKYAPGSLGQQCVLGTGSGTEGTSMYALAYINGSGYFGFAHSYIYANSASAGYLLTAGSPFEAKVAMKNASQVAQLKKEGDSSFESYSKTQSATLATNKSMYLFAGNNADSAVWAKCPSGSRLYFCKIYSDNSFTTLVFDGIPCVYNGEYGLWDKVSNTFFGNAAGTGAFTGPSIS